MPAGMGQATARVWKAALVACAFACGAEIAVRASRVDDVPLYRADNHIGYIPAPNQSGAFIWTHRWAFNALSMGTDRPFTPHVPGSILLVGDSLVLGGNPYRAEDRLGPQLERVTGRRVWPIGAGSWALQNELQYLQDHPDVVAGVDRVVIVSNSGDFGSPSAWANELTHPRRRHWSSAWQLWLKYAWPSTIPAVPEALRVRPRNVQTQLNDLASRVRRPVIVMIYPNRAEEQNAARCGFAVPAMLRIPKVRIFCVKPARAWTASLYRDEIHPDADGMATLAHLIAAVLNR